MASASPAFRILACLCLSAASAGCGAAQPPSFEEPICPRRVRVEAPRDTCFVRSARWLPSIEHLAMTSISQTLVTEASWAVAVARARLLTEAEPSLTEEEADALASTASAWLDQLAAEPFGSPSCAHVSSASEARFRVLYAVEATRDYLERNVRASAPLLALRAHIARTDARVSPACAAAEPDPVLSALLTHVLELSTGTDVTAPEAILCADLRTFDFRFAPASEHIDGCLRQPTFYAGARLCDEPRCGRAISVPLAPHVEGWAAGHFTSSGAHASSVFDVVLGRVDGVWRVLSEELVSQYCY